MSMLLEPPTAAADSHVILLGFTLPLGDLILLDFLFVVSFFLFVLKKKKRFVL